MLSRQHDKLKRAVKYTAIGLATAYVVGTGCQELYQRPQATIELNMERYQSAPADGTLVAHPTLDTLLCPTTQPLEEE